jgi:predicted ATP-grasp superfamily ATP-dependent carboligase
MYRSDAQGSGPQRLDAIVLDAAQRASLVCVRSWGRDGLRVGAFDSTSHTPAAASRWSAVAGRVPAEDADPERLSAAVLELVERYRPKVVVTTHDGTLEALRAARGELERYTRLAIPSEDALRVATSKPRTLALAEEIGVGVPLSARVASVDDLDEALRSVGLPAVLKPDRSWIHEQRHRVVSQAVTSREQARGAMRAFERAGTHATVQQWLPGIREGVSLFCVGGQVLARFVQVAHRMTPPLGGSSVLRESIPPHEEVVRPAEQLAGALHFDGYCEIEFRRDRAGRPRLMEVNPRLSASIEIAVRAGVDFPAMIYRAAAGLELHAVDAYRYGLRTRWLGGDLRWLQCVLSQQGQPDVPPVGRALGALVKDFLEPTTYDYGDLRDPRPALVAGASLLRAALTPSRWPRRGTEPRTAMPRQGAAIRSAEVGSGSS